MDKISANRELEINNNEIETLRKGQQRALADWLLDDSKNSYMKHARSINGDITTSSNNSVVIAALAYTAGNNQASATHDSFRIREQSDLLVNKKKDEKDQDCDPLSTSQPCASAGVSKSSTSSAPSWMSATSCNSDSGNTMKPNYEICLPNTGGTTMEQGSANRSYKKKVKT